MLRNTTLNGFQMVEGSMLVLKVSKGMTRPMMTRLSSKTLPFGRRASWPRKCHEHGLVRVAQFDAHTVCSMVRAGQRVAGSKKSGLEDDIERTLLLSEGLNRIAPSKGDQLCVHLSCQFGGWTFIKLAECVKRDKLEWMRLRLRTCPLDRVHDPWPSCEVQKSIFSFWKVCFLGGRCACRIGEFAQHMLRLHNLNVHGDALPLSLMAEGICTPLMVAVERERKQAECSFFLGLIMHVRRR